MALIKISFKEGERSKAVSIIGEDGLPIVCIPENSIMIQEERFDRYKEELERANIFPIYISANYHKQTNSYAS
jgi:hypothetical protein